MAHLRAMILAPFPTDSNSDSNSNVMKSLVQDLASSEGSVERLTYSAESTESDASNIDLLILMVHADRGISQQEIETFNSLRERQIPSLILVTSLMPTDGLPLAEDRWDFDDITMLITRTMEKPITPYLVLHDDEGMPIALYDLDDDQVIDYTSGKRQVTAGDDELREVVREFKEEFDEEDFSTRDFTSGLRVVALPYVPERMIGSNELKSFITMLQQAQL